MENPLTVAIRFALYADLMLLFGVSVMALYMAGGRTGWGAGQRVALLLAVFGLGLSLLSVVAMTASMEGVSLTQVDSAALRSMIFETPMGSAWMVRAGALVALGLAAILAPGAIVPRAGLSAVAVATLAWTGHGAAGDGVQGDVQLIADIAHLLAASAWIGAIVQLASMVVVRADAALTHRALEGFAGAGTVLVGLVVASGMINANYLIGWHGWDKAIQSPYGAIFVLKLILFVGMIGAAASNRFRLAPALERAMESDRTAPAFRGLQLSLLLELSLGILILALVAWLGTLVPPMST